MAKARLHADVLLAWLPWVDLPRMEIEYARLPVDRVHTPQAPARHAIRQQPKIATAACRQVAIEKTHRGHRQFQQSVRAFRIEREARSVWHAIVIVAYRVNAGTVAIARFFQGRLRPEIGAADGEAGSAIPL